MAEGHEHPLVKIRSYSKIGERIHVDKLYDIWMLDEACAKLNCFKSTHICIQISCFATVMNIILFNFIS